jgi:hypothetical protein
MTHPYVRLLNIAAGLLQVKVTRVGQAYSNALTYVDPELSICVNNTSFDPYYNDANLQRFMIYCQYQWHMLDEEILQIGIERENDATYPSTEDR